MKTTLMSLFAVLFFSGPVSANVLGDMQTFAPSTDGQDFITVHSGRPLKKGFWAFSGYFNYAKNHLLVFDDLDTQVKQDYSDELTEFDLDVAYAWNETLQLFLAAPILLQQSSGSDMNPRVSITRGVHSWRPGFKWTFSNQEDRFWAFIFSTDFMNVIDNPYTGENTTPIVNAEIAGTWRSGSLTKAVNVGYRLRDPGPRPASARMFPLDDQLIFSAGLSGAFSPTARWVTEGIFSYPINKEPYNRALDAASADLLVGMKHRWYKNLNFDWGATIEPGLGTLAPDWRVFTGLVYYWAPKPSSAPSTPRQRTSPPPPPVEEEVPLQTDFAAADDLGASLRDLTEGLSLTPEEAEVYEGGRIQLTADGGAPPYRFRITRGTGRIGPNGLYRAPTRAGSATVQVVDSEGTIAESTLQIIAPPRPDRLIRLGNLKFKFDSDQLIGSSQKDLEEAIATLRTMRVKRLIVEGHTDWIGDNLYNQDLSERRAQTIRQALIRGLSLSPSAIEAIGYGQDRPIANNQTAEGRQRNRRVDLKVYTN